MSYHFFADPTRRVILPRTSEGCKGLLIPEAVMVTDGVKQLLTPFQYAQLADRPEIHCPCGTKIYYTPRHRVDGSFDVPDHFKTAPGGQHAQSCGYHFRKSARDLQREEHEYDLTKPYRIHLNIADETVRNASIAKDAGLFYNRDEAGLPINETFKDWQPVSIKSMDELISFMAAAEPMRLAKSLVILNQQAVPWGEFCMSYRREHRWSHLYNDVSRGHKFLRFFLLQKTRPEQKDLFTSDPHSIAMDQIKFQSAGHNIVMNPRLKVSPETLDLCARTGVVAVLSVAPSLQRAIMHQGAQTQGYSLNAENPAFVGRVDNLSVLVEAAEMAAAAAKTSSISPNPS